MVTRLCRFLQQYNILYEYHFGFRQYYSITFALFDVVDDICKHLDNNETGIGIYLDLKKAFGTVNHKIQIKCVVVL